MLMLECLEVIERIFSSRNRLALLTYLDLLEAFKMIFLQSFWYHLMENCMLIILVQKSEKLSQ